jgi:hypothetical protein
MKPAGSLALIINTFNQPEALGRVLAAVSRQTPPPAEVVLAAARFGKNDFGVDRFCAHGPDQRLRGITA